MRCVLTILVLGFLVVAGGCHPWVRPDDRSPPNRGTPKPEELVAYLNNNAHLISALEAFSVDIDAKQEGQAIGLMGTLACQKTEQGSPPNFRLQARVLGTSEVDIGSNREEFWYWIGKSPQPYVFHCSYADFRAGRATMPFPFQPEWIAEALGVAEVKLSPQCKVRETERTYELVELTESPQKQPVKKVTVFSRDPAKTHTPRVMEHQLLDVKGNLICSAQIQRDQTDQTTGAVVPYIIKMCWKKEKMELTMRLKEIRLNGPIDEARAASLFTRNLLRDKLGYDLARGPDAPTSQIRPAGGVLR